MVCRTSGYRNNKLSEEFYVGTIQSVLKYIFQHTPFLKIDDIRYNYLCNRIDGVIVSVFASSAVDRGFEPCSGQTKDYKFGICCFSTKHTALRKKSKDWLARNQNNVSE